jgi:hypothetical protein
LVQKIATEHHGSDFVFVEEPDAKAELWKVSRAFNLKRILIPPLVLYIRSCTHVKVADIINQST